MPFLSGCNSLVRTSTACSCQTCFTSSKLEFGKLHSHTIRILFAAGGDKVQELNERFRRVPTFGRDNIRRFVGNMADMKKLGARDLEDLTQCSIPVFEGLLPEPFNSTLMDLLWDLATWHALAKLRMHTSSTIVHLERVTTALG